MRISSLQKHETNVVSIEVVVTGNISGGNVKKMSAVRTHAKPGQAMQGKLAKVVLSFGTNAEQPALLN
jgi:hypothetical protein